MKTEKAFPTLFQKTNTGAIQTWRIFVLSDVSGSPPGPNRWGIIKTVWGQANGALQETTDVIKEGKNSGKANATSALAQALKEAEAKWLKQKKKGYVEDMATAEAGKVDTTVILGGIAPMLAPNKCYPTDANLAKKIVFPAYVQPKLDGVRCIAVIVDGKATLWSRTRKPIKSVPHIVAALEGMFGGKTVTLDGELYSHDYRDEFEELISIVRKDEPDAEGRHLVMQYHIYDVVMDGSFEERMNRLETVRPHVRGETIHFVDTKRVLSTKEAQDFQVECEVKGYEGAMIRNALGTYEQDRRSPHLQKMKSWMTGEFPIVGVEEGRGKDAGTVGAFVVRVDTPPTENPLFEGSKKDATFKVRLKASYARRRELLENPRLWKAKQLTTRFKRWTADGVAYLPIGLAIRDYE